MRRLIAYSTAVLLVGGGIEGYRGNLGVEPDGRPFLDTTAVWNDLQRTPEAAMGFLQDVLRHAKTARAAGNEPSEPVATASAEATNARKPGKPAASQAPKPQAEVSVPHFDPTLRYADAATTRNAAFELWEAAQKTHGVTCPKTPSGGRLSVAGKLLCLSINTSTVNALPGGESAMFSAPAVLVDQQSGAPDTAASADATLETIPNPSKTCTIVRATLLGGMGTALRGTPSADPGQHFFVALTGAGPCDAAVQPPSSPVQRVR